MFPYDPVLLAAVEAAPQTIADVVQTMQTIEATCSDGDGLKWFNWLYLQVTQAVETRVAAAGFSDPSWLAKLDVQFARLYFSALKSSLSGRPAPSCWQTLFRNRNQPAIARIQFALAGINSHINHDLAAAIVNTCRVTGVTPDDRGTHYADYSAVNDTLQGIVDSAKKTLDVRLLGDALPPISRLEDTVAAWNVCAAREAAWQNAQHLWHLRAIPVLAAGFLDTLDGFTTVISKALLVPVPCLPAA
ncbi:MAG TPA: DUF5995 family protein [Bryobacteraceae bacterium]|nr:DUF5995 family protein [Bryobacteraceae bacterium]